MYCIKRVVVINTTASGGVVPAYARHGSNWLRLVAPEKGPSSGIREQDIRQQGVPVGGAEESMTANGPKTISVREGTFLISVNGKRGSLSICQSSRILCSIGYQVLKPREDYYRGHDDSKT